MVQWKGNLQKSEVGEKAANLNSLNRFDVPNFFVLTKSEVDKFIDAEEPREVANKQLPDEIVEKVREAYEDIGMSSEVRNASGQARDLVGNQRESQRVSVRISKNENGADYRLNVGASDLEEAIRDVLSSYFRENSGTPAIIFQKMIEPEYTGAVVPNYTRRYSLVEVVEGLGHSLEEGTAVPEFYLLQDSSVQSRRVPDKQAKVSRNPMNGQRRTRNVSRDSPAFSESEVESLVNKSSRESLAIKFVYKRGSFYAVDAFQNQAMNVDPDLQALKVSEGEIKGREGKDYILSDEVRQTNRPLISRKGGFTSTESQRKRKRGVPMVVSLADDSKIINDGEEEERSNGSKSAPEPDVSKNLKDGAVTATEVRAIEEFPSLSDNPFSIQDSEDKFVDSCEMVLSDQPGFIDGRSIESEALIRCIELLDGVTVLAVREVSDELLEQVVDTGVEALAVPRDAREAVEKKLLRAEKRFIMENLRN